MQFKDPSDSGNYSSGTESDASTTSNDPRTEPPPKNPEMICEVREYEGRMNLKGEKVVTVKKDKEDVDETDKKEGKHYAMKSYRHYERDGTLESSYVEIYSPHIKKALRTVVKKYPGVSFQGEVIIINGQLRCIFHYRKELEEYRQALEGSISKLHIRLLLRFMEQQLRNEIKSYNAHVETAKDEPCLEFDNIWMGFIPEELIITGRDEELQLLVLKSVTMTKDCDGPFWNLIGYCLTHDGNHFGYSNKSVDIRKYLGTRRIKDLKGLPLRYFSTEEGRERVKDRLGVRGKKFCGLMGYHHRSYKGLAYALSDQTDYVSSPPAGWKHRLDTVTINSRIIVDSKTFGVSKAPNRVWLAEHKIIGQNAKTEMESLSSEDFMICDYRIPGFSLLDKKWCWFSVDLIEPVAFNSGAFKTLLIPERQKSIVHALVKNHGSDDFDDMIKGKGKGLVFVLYGEPGVGKTFTAESVADNIQRPLYVLNSGELGVEPRDVESTLGDALKLAEHWGAIVLIDEADVFLEQRTIHDLQRNSLVSLFLRTLEYYEGILFLTTNRLTSFDLAFKSRIHLALKYSPLNQDRRRALWKHFIERTSKDALQTWPSNILDDLSKADLNGRQIKNAVRTANTLATSTNSALDKDHIEMVLETIREFEADFQDTTVDSAMSHTLSRRSTGLSRVIGVDG